MKDNIMLLVLFACLYFLVTGKLSNTSNVRTLDVNNKKLSKRIQKLENNVKYIKRELML